MDIKLSEIEKEIKDAKKNLKKSFGKIEFLETVIFTVTDAIGIRIGYIADGVTGFFSVVK